MFIPSIINVTIRSHYIHYNIMYNIYVYKKKKTAGNKITVGFGNLNLNYIIKHRFKIKLKENI